MKTDREGRRLVVCPGCGGDSVYAPDNPHRPFCSERCRNQDLGAWANESYRVPTAPAESQDDSPDEAARSGH